MQRSRLKSPKCNEGMRIAPFSVRERGSVLHRTRPKCETRKKGARCAPDFAAKPPREQSSREGARADARRNAQSSSGGADLSAPNAMRGCDLRRFKCEDEGAYYIVRDQSARHAKRTQGAPLILRRSRPASKVLARERERTRGGPHNPRAEERNGTLRAEEQTQAHTQTLRRDLRSAANDALRLRWWRLSDLNQRPPACKADALTN